MVPFGGRSWFHRRRGQIGIVLTMTVISFVNIRSVVPDSVLALYFTPTVFLHHIFAIWTGNDFGQRLSGENISYIPITLFDSTLHVLGLSVLAMQRVWFTVLLSVSAIGMAAFYSSWWGDKHEVQPLIAGLLYALNPYVLLNLKGSTVLLIPYVLLPIVCRQTILLVRNPRLISLLGIGVTGGILMAGVNPPVYAIAIFVVILIGITEVARLKFSRRSLIGLGLTLASIAFFCLWWLVPFMNSLKHGGGTGYFTTDPLSLTASSSSFTEVLRLTGLWALPQGWQGIPYFPSQAFLLSRTVIVVTLLAPLGFLAWIASRWSDLRAKALAIAMVVAVFMAVSIYPPLHPSIFGDAYRWLYGHLYAFRAFRSVYKWEVPLAFAYALTLPNLIRGAPASPLTTANSSTTPSLRKLGRRFDVASLLTQRPMYGSLLVVLLLLTYAAPFADGLLFPASYRSGKIPTYWHEATSWLNAQPRDGSVLFLPFQGFSVYNWGSPGGDIAPLFLNRPEITQEYGINFPASVQSLLNLFQDPNQTENWGGILTELGVQYVVQQNDANWQFYNSPSPSQMKGLLSSINSLRHVKTFGKLDIYAVRGGGHSSVGVTKGILSVLTDIPGATPLSTRSNSSDYLTRSASASLSNSLIKSVHASSVWNNLKSQYGPQNVIDGGQSTAWVSSVPYSTGQWIQLNFTRATSIHRLLIVGRRDGIDALPNVLRVSAGNYSKKVTLNAQGIAMVAMPNHFSKDLRVTILSSRRGGPNVGISKIEILGAPTSTVQYPDVPANGPSEIAMTLSPMGAQILPHVLSLTTRTISRVAWTAGLNPQESGRTLANFLKPVGVVQVSASSRWNNLAAYSPLWAIAGDSHFSWVCNRPGGIGQWIQFKFPVNRWVGFITLTGRNDGVDAEVSRISLSNNSRLLGNRTVKWSANGTSTIYVGRNVSSLRITILASQKGRPGSNVGFHQISIPGVSVQRNFALLRSASSLIIHKGALSGPSQSYSMAVKLASTQQADEFAAGIETFSGASPVELNAGRNYVVAGTNTLNETLSLNLTIGQPSVARIRWLSARQNFNSGVFTESVPKGYDFVLLNESPDSLWKASISSKLLHRTVQPTTLGATWSLDGHNGALRISYANADNRNHWLVVWLLSASLLVLVGTTFDIIHRRSMKIPKV